jgi:hypothetical protein
MRRGTARTGCFLGLKGSLKEYELDLLRQCSLSARCEKARRGALVVSAPVGFVKTGAPPSRAQHFVRANGQHRCRHAHGVARVASGGHRGPCLDRLKGGHSSGGPHRHARRDWHRQHRHRRHTTTRCGGRIGREFFAAFGNKARPRPAVVARWGGQRRPEWLSNQSSAARSARGALVKRLRIHTVIGVQFWSILHAE